MSKHRTSTYLAWIVLGLLVACSGSREHLDEQKYRAWYSQSAEELQVTKTVNQLRLQARYIPGDYSILRWLDAGGRSQPLNIDSLRQAAQYLATFEVRIAPENPGGEDVMFRGVNGYEGYDQRVKDLSFRSEDQFLLRSDSLEARPVLSHFENNIGLTREKVLTLVFSLDQPVSELSGFTLTWDDYNFETGRHHFVFPADRINPIPFLNYETLFDHENV